MPINKNHEFEDLNGVKCSIVERNASAERVAFLQALLQQNGYEVIVVVSAPPKAAPVKPAPPIADGTLPASVENTPEPPVAAPTFTIGVTDVMFNPVNAIFGRLLRTATGEVVTLAYWEEHEKVADDSVPYFEKPKYE